MIHRFRSSSAACLWVVASACLGVECHGRIAPFKALPLVSVRGGSNAPSLDVYSQQQQQQQQQQQAPPQTPPPQSSGSSSFLVDPPPSSYDPQQEQWLGQDPFLEQEERQTVQERVDAWRQHQQQLQQQVDETAAGADPRLDEQGRMKLLTGVSKTSRALIFFILMWRDVHLYEVADQSFKGLGRLFLVLPLMALFVANMAGAVASITSPNHSANKRLKAILNLDKVVEALLLVYYLLRLTVLPSKLVPREVFIANTMHSVFFILQCQAFTRLSWDNPPSPPITATTTTTNPYYDDDDFLDDGSSFSYTPPLDSYPSDPPIASYQQ